jgi:hypothetical protein
MLKSSDLIRLAYSPDLTQAGIAIASRKLASGSIAGNSIDTRQLQREIAQTSGALAFHRYLIEQKIPFQLQQFSPFSQPEHATAVLGGRKCAIETSLITDVQTAGQTSHSAKRLLETSIRVPAGMHTSGPHGASDLAVFTFAIASVTDDRNSLLRKAEAGEPYLCSHVMPEAWRQPGKRKARGPLSFRYAGDTGISLEIFGLGVQHELCVEQVVVEPQSWVQSQQRYSALSCLHAGPLPTARLEIRRAAQRSAYTILPLQWRNLWLYGREIILIGYLTFEEIWELARAAPVRPHKPATDLEVAAIRLHALPAYLAQVARRSGG